MNALPSFDRLLAPGEAPDPYSPLSVGILSTYAPTVCGLATFSAALAGGLAAHGVDVRVVRIADGASSAADAVVGELVNGSPSSVAQAADQLSGSSVAVIQHEYGIYGGRDGDEVVEIMKRLTVPSIVVTHTVLKDPTAHQRSVLDEVLRHANSVVVMSEAARGRLCAGYAVDPNQVTIIPHGAAPSRFRAANGSGRPTILTWGLLGPGKGVERVIEAMAVLKDLPQRPRYLVAGRTHPKVLAAQGESYRNGLVAQAQRLGVGDSVSFDSAYRTPEGVTELLAGAAVVVLPYDSKDQVTSGVLVDSIASGRPVVATAFPHAVEVLGSGAGTVVGHDDPDALVDALRRLLTDPRVAGSMAFIARELAPAMAWPVVATAYAGLARRLLADRMATA